MNIHPELKKAIIEKDYKTICKFLHTNHFESDSEWTFERCNDSFVQGWIECEKQIERLQKKCEIYENCLELIKDCLVVAQPVIVEKIKRCFEQAEKL